MKHKLRRQFTEEYREQQNSMKRIGLISDTHGTFDQTLKTFLKDVDEIVTACPLCRYNLVKNGMGEEASVPVVYFTELMAEAFGIKNGAANGSAAVDHCGCAVNGKE